LVETALAHPANTAQGGAASVILILATGGKGWASPRNIPISLINPFMTVLLFRLTAKAKLQTKQRPTPR